MLARGVPAAAAAAALVAAGYALCRVVDALAERERRRQHELSRKLKHREHKKRRRGRKAAGAAPHEHDSASEGEEQSGEDGGSGGSRTPSPAPGEAAVSPSAAVSSSTHVRVHGGKLDLGALAALVASPRAGAVVTFSGTTRDSFEGKRVVSLEYEAYVGMAEKKLREIAVNVREKWPDVIHIAVEHKVGNCPIGESSVVIAVSSPHRATALDSARFCLDQLKALVPIWKKEVYAGAAATWKENAEFFAGPGRSASP
jgi:molybdopterin synthase catalytic subunit